MHVIECRRAAIEDLVPAAQLRAEMAVEMGNDLDASGTGWRAKFCEFFGEKQRAGCGQLFLAFDGAAPIGMTIISLAQEWRSFCFGTRFGFVNAVYVKPEYRRRGVGRQLLDAATLWAREKGCVRVRLRTSEEGRRLYESAGFVPGREMELEL